MNDWFKIYQWIKYPIFFGFGVFMMIILLDNQFWNYIHSKPIYAEGIAMLLFALWLTILLSVSSVFFMNEILNKIKRQSKPGVEHE